MNILLDGFYDLNYGDDIFIHTVTKLFPQYKFYSFLEHYPEHVIEWANKIPNLYLLPDCNVFLGKNLFDAYMCVGGDIFPDNGDFTKRKQYVQAVKAIGGAVIFWGFSLFHSYSQQTQADLKEMMGCTDVIAPRDQRSADYLRKLLPEKEITPIADLAFLSQWTAAEKKARLGISVRRPNYATEEDMLRYTGDLAKAINTYLSGDPAREAILFSLSDGLTSDRGVAEQILDGVQEPQRVIHSIYTGNIDEIKAQIAGCELMICTRLHAMVSCIAMNVPFIPIAYEVKMEHILQDIGYRKEIIHFQNTQPLALQLAEALQETAEPLNVDGYVRHTVAVKERVQALLAGSNQPIAKNDPAGPSCQEREELTQTFQTALNQRATDVATLEAALTQRATDVATLENALKEQAANIQELCATIGENNEKISQLEGKLQKIEATLPYKAYRAVKSVFSRD